MQVHQYFKRALESASALFAFFEENLAHERSRWVLWIPVALGIGIGFYFGLSHEPYWAAYGGPVVIGGAFGLIWKSHQACLKFTGWALFWAALGFFLAFLRTCYVNPRPLEASLGPLWITGIIEGLDHPASSQRLFQRVILKTLTKRLPTRVSLTIRTSSTPLQEGYKIRVKAKLAPLPGPCFPGGYDPRRQAFFQGIGASGFALTSPEILGWKEKAFSQWRHSLTRRLHQGLPPPLGALACSLVTGDTASLPLSVREVFSASGMAHLLAISGLHISIVSGICFVLFQRYLAYIPSLALYVNLDKIAAFFSLAVGWVYLMISGQKYPAQRSFLMMAAAMIAMMVSRRRHSLRIVMLCAALFLLITPEALINISYQLSFVAVASLVAFYEWKAQRSSTYAKVHSPYMYTRFYHRLRLLKRNVFKRKILRAVIRTVSHSLTSSALITAMTLPLIIFHFHHLSFQGLISNMIAIPLTSLVVMPVGLAALVLLATPLGPYGLAAWGYTLKGLLLFAQISADSLRFLMMPAPRISAYTLFGALFGVLWVLLWKRRWRWSGMAVAAGALFFKSPQSTILIEGDHKIVGYIDLPRRILWVSSKRKGKFVAQRWAQAYGLNEIVQFSEGALMTLPDGKKIALLPSGPVKADWILSWDPLKEGVAHLAVSTLPKGAAVEVRGAGTEVIFGPWGRPWSLPKQGNGDRAGESSKTVSKAESIEKRGSPSS